MMQATGEPRDYRLNGLLVFAIALALWAIAPFGFERDWFYRSSVYAVAGGTVFSAVIATWAFLEPTGQGHEKNWFLAWWHGRALEHWLFGNRVDLKMYLLCGWWDDVGAERVVRGVVPPSALWRRC